MDNNEAIKSHYNQQARRFGGFKNTFSHISDQLPKNDPELIFLEKIKEYGGSEKVALDVGAGDGQFTIKLASYYKKIYAIDFSEEMIKIAKKENARDNIEYLARDVADIALQPKSVDVAWSRRGPTLKNLSLFKDHCAYLQVKIAYRDCFSLKKIFGRGQDFEKIDINDVEELIQIYRPAGFKIKAARRFRYNNFYPKEEDFRGMLETYPIMPNFEIQKERKKYDKYLEKFRESKGIKLEREKILFLAER